MRNAIYIAIFIILFSCEKGIVISIPNPEDKIVVDGQISNTERPRVILSHNKPYFEPLDNNYLQEFLILDAKVYIKSPIGTDTLSITTYRNEFPYLIFSSKKIIATPGFTYQLNIIYNGNHYTANTYISNPVKIDSLSFRTFGSLDTLGYVWIYFKDPDTLGNYYRFFTKKISKEVAFSRPYSSILDDKLINGLNVEYPLYHGINPNMVNDSSRLEESFTGPSRYLFAYGDTVVVKLCSIDYQFYKFIKSSEQQLSTGENPFASPFEVTTNINGNALGVWGGYSSDFDTIIISKKILNKK